MARLSPAGAAPVILGRCAAPQAREGDIRPQLRVISGARVARDDVAGAQDAAFARALAAGEPEAVRAFTARCLPMVHGLARRLLRDEAEAEDVAQETFVKAWRKAGGWTPGAARFDSWVGRIAINLCYDRLRKRREDLSDDPPDMADDGPGADAALAGAQTAARVRAAVAALPARQRLALELCCFQDRTNIEAAEMMEASVEAVESLLARARRTLKTCLAGESAEMIAALDAAGAGGGEDD